MRPFYVYMWTMFLKSVTKTCRDPPTDNTISGLSYNITDPVWCRQCQFSELVQCTIIMYNNDTATGKSLIMLSVIFLFYSYFHAFYSQDTYIGKICALNIHLQHISVIYQQFNWNYCFSASIAGPPWPRRATTPAPGTPATSARPRWEINIYSLNKYT